MTIHEYHLNFDAPVHIGMEGIGQERIEPMVRSDTLWGAIIQKWLLLYNDDPEVLSVEPLFVLSSCFPVIDGTPFFPVPVGALDSIIQAAAEDERPYAGFKTYKKIQFIAKPLFQNTLAGKRIDAGQLSARTAWPFPAAREKDKHTAYHIRQRPRLQIDPLRGGAAAEAFFYCADQYFPETCGLFFLASFLDEQAKTRFEAALRLLGDCGLGADRSVGRGTFTFMRTSSDQPFAEQGGEYLLLSLWHPTEEEVGSGMLAAEGVRYSLIRRFGHAASLATSRYRRADVLMVTEGAVLPQRPRGDVVCVLKKADGPPLVPHNVYRNGRAFVVPITKKRG